MQNRCERSFVELPCLGVPSLSTAEQFIVGVSRCWDTFMADPDPALAWRELAPAFAYMDVLGALCAFDAAFHAVHRHGCRTLVFQEVDWPMLGLAEARLLGSIAALQRGDARAASRMLKGSLCRNGIHCLLPPLARIAALLDAKGHRLPAWRDCPCSIPEGSMAEVREVGGGFRLGDVESLRKAYS